MPRFCKSPFVCTFNMPVRLCVFGGHAGLPRSARLRRRGGFRCCGGSSTNPRINQLSGGRCASWKETQPQYDQKKFDWDPRPAELMTGLGTGPAILKTQLSCIVGLLGARLWQRYPSLCRCICRGSAARSGPERAWRERDHIGNEIIAWVLRSVPSRRRRGNACR